MTDEAPPAVLPRALRAAAPLLAGHGVVLVSGFLLQAALVAWVFRPEEMATVGLLSTALQWVVVVSLMGLPAGLLRHVPVRPGEERDLLATAQTLVLATTVALAVIATLVPGVSRALLGEDEAASLFRLYAWRAVPLAQIVLVAAWFHAQGRLKAKAALDASERTLILALALGWASTAGLPGYAKGALAASAAVCFAVLSLTRVLGMTADGGGWSYGIVFGSLRRFRARLCSPLLRVGAPQLAVSVLEALRPLVVLRLATMTSGDTETGLLATAMGFSLPLIALPELAAQALFPGMHGPAGEGSHVRGEARGVLRETLVVGGVVLGVYAVAAVWLLPLAGHGRYAGAVAAVLALLPGVLAHGVSSHAGYLLLIRDRLAAAAAASAVSVVVAGVLAWKLLPAMGAAGGALALSVAALVRTAIILVAARRA